jgi:hypothetical protein
MQEVERPLAGHTAVGQWPLAQILNHLAGTIRGRLVGDIA